MSGSLSKQTYEKLREEFIWNPPDNYNFADDVIDFWANKDNALLAMKWIYDNYNRRDVTFLELSERSKRLANVLTVLGVKRGDVIILVVGREVEWWEVLTGSIRMGAVCSPGTTQLSAKDIAYRIQAARAVCFIGDVDNASKLDEVIDDCPTLKAKIVIGGSLAGWNSYEQVVSSAPVDFGRVDTKYEDHALCYFTSGTTGYPKMTIHNHGYGYAHQITGKYWLDLKPGDLHWNISDTGWAKAAYSSYFGPWNQGATLFVHHSPVFDPVKTLDLLSENPVTTMCGAPTIYRMLVLQDLANYKFPSLRHCVGAGEPLNPEVIETWLKATGITIRDGYGQTETVLACGNYPILEPRLGSMGKPAPGIEMGIIDSEGTILGADQEGDIAIKVKPDRAPGLFVDYRGDPERFKSCFIGDWYITGDRGKVDEEGYYWFVSRADDVILSAGYRIGPFEVESALIEHESVAESAVVASPDGTRGAVVKAFVVLAPGFEKSDALVTELQEHVKSTTAPYKYPRKIEFVESLPKTVSGKIRRIELREREGL
ncbi:MAG: AMP-binding protein [Pseudomonadota bacterium]|nr:AMP-binding protein [Pseudomonadota bacterium]